MRINYIMEWVVFLMVGIIILFAGQVLIWSALDRLADLYDRFRLWLNKRAYLKMKRRAEESGDE